MADKVEITNDSGSPARVAYDMMVWLRAYVPRQEGDGTVALQGAFNLYAECYQLALGRDGDATKVLK